MRWKLVLLILFLTTQACSANGTPQIEPESETARLAEDQATLVPTQPAVPPTLAAVVVNSPNIISLHMFNELDGWAISEGAILRTNDGSSTWYNLSPQGVTEFGYGTANTFLNASQAWVMVTDATDQDGSGLLYRTSDGGLTWTVYPVPFGSGDLTFIDDNTGWMMASLGAGAGSMAVAIYQTTDGGATWKQTFTNDPTQGNASDSLPLGGIKNDLIALDAGTAWVTGVIYAPATFYLYKTTNGGQSWAPQTIPAPPGLVDFDVSIDSGPLFFSSRHAVLPIRFMDENLHTGFYATQNRGESWEFVSYMPGSGAVDFVTESDGFFWTGEQFFVTTDGAQTWKTINADVLFGESFAGMDFVNTRTGWVWTYGETGQRGLYKTTDGGATWLPMGN